MEEKDKDVKKKQKNPIKVFISYSHDSEKHRKQVLELAKKLTKDGISCILDQLLYKGYPIEGWTLWAERSILEADSVLIIYTEGFYNRLMGKVKEEEGRGVKWEATSIYNQIFKDNAKIDRFIPVLFNESDEQYIPPRLSGVPYYYVNTDDGYKSLYLRLTNKSYVEEELEFPLPPKNEIRRETEEKESKNGRMKFIKYLIISMIIFIASFILFDPLKIIKEKRQESMQSMKTEIGEDKQYPKYIDAVNGHINNEFIREFQRAMHNYNDGQYNFSKRRIERLIAILEVKGLEVEEKDILGKCYLLLGAIFEKEKNAELAEKNYRTAKDEYGIQSINGINLDDFKVFESVFKNEKTKIQRDRQSSGAPPITPTIAGEIVLGNSNRFGANWRPLGEGVQITRLSNGSLKRAGLLVGDILVEVDSKKVVGQGRDLETARDDVFYGKRTEVLINVLRGDKALLFKMIKRKR